MFRRIDYLDDSFGPETAVGVGLSELFDSSGRHRGRVTAELHVQSHGVVEQLANEGERLRRENEELRGELESVRDCAGGDRAELFSRVTKLGESDEGNSVRLGSSDSTLGHSHGRDVKRVALLAEEVRGETTLVVSTTCLARTRRVVDRIDAERQHQSLLTAATTDTVRCYFAVSVPELSGPSQSGVQQRRGSRRSSARFTFT
ncbi:hypothetical protein [Halobaculum sp. MBLA0143]|uniref:hypothetical protein n=1 Tax=Halobaculum sp. MBLA0143 TaxID=3079933 RepID=UPI0035253BDB